MSEINFVHISDVHIGKEKVELLFGGSISDDGWESLADAVTFAKEKRADFLFITGDLFDVIPGKSQLQKLDEMLKQLENTTVIYCQGKHDFLKAGCALSNFEFASNVYVIGAEKYRNGAKLDTKMYGMRHENATASLDVIFFEKLNTYIFGPGYYAEIVKGEVLDGVAPFDSSSCNVLLAYAGYEEGIPVKFPALRKAGFDYVGLGSRHSYMNMYNGRLCYGGALTPVDSADYGTHGFIHGVIQDGISVKFIPSKCHEFKNIDYPVSNFMDSDDLEYGIRKLIIREGSENAYRINLIRGNGCEKNFEVADRLAGFKIIEVIGEKFVRTDYSEYLKANKGNSFGKLLDMMDGSTPEMADAAKIAVDAIIEEEGICYRSNKRLADKVFAGIIEDAILGLKGKCEKTFAVTGLAEYERDMEHLQENSDVLELLNDTWAKERKQELALRTARNGAEQILPKHKRTWLKWGVRTAILPFVAYVLYTLFYMPYICVKYSESISKGNLLVTLLVGLVIVCITFFLGYGAARSIDGNRKKGLAVELAASAAEIQDLQIQVEKTRALRKELQMKDNYRRELLEHVSAEEERVQKAYYEVKVLRRAVEILKGFAS